MNKVFIHSKVEFLTCVSVCEKNPKLCGQSVVKVGKKTVVLPMLYIREMLTFLWFLLELKSLNYYYTNLSSNSDSLYRQTLFIKSATRKCFDRVYLILYIVSKG